MLQDGAQGKKVKQTKRPNKNKNKSTQKASGNTFFCCGLCDGVLCLCGTEPNQTTQSCKRNILC